MGFVRFWVSFSIVFIGLQKAQAQDWGTTDPKACDFWQDQIKTEHLDQQFLLEAPCMPRGYIRCAMGSMMFIRRSGDLTPQEESFRAELQKELTSRDELAKKIAKKGRPFRDGVLSCKISERGSGKETSLGTFHIDQGTGSPASNDFQFYSDQNTSEVQLGYLHKGRRHWACIHLDDPSKRDSASGTKEVESLVLGPAYDRVQCTRYRDENSYALGVHRLNRQLDNLSAQLDQSFKRKDSLSTPSRPIHPAAVLGDGKIPEALGGGSARGDQ